MTRASGKKSKSFPPPDHSHPYEVTKGLYISGHPDRSQDFLNQGVHAVIDLEGDIGSAVPVAEEQSATTLYLYWPVEDGPMPDPETVRSIAAFTARPHASDGKVLVHCRSGHNRSGLICVRTLIEQGADPDKAIEQVRAKRGDGHALDNESFVEWLKGEPGTDHPKLGEASFRSRVGLITSSSSPTTSGGARNETSHHRARHRGGPVSGHRRVRSGRLERR